MKAGRFLFETKTDYAGRLVEVSRRNVENDESDAVLLRLEFEIYGIFVKHDEQIILNPTGAIASRDLIVSSTCNHSPRVQDYARIFELKDYKRAKTWHLLNQRANTKPGVWLTIRFGQPDGKDFRQPFDSISKFSWGDNCFLNKDITHQLRDLFLPVSKVRGLLQTRQGKHPSDENVTNFVDKHRARYGDNLVRMKGNQRRINWYLCWHLWEAESRIAES